MTFLKQTLPPSLIYIVRQAKGKLNFIAIKLIGAMHRSHFTSNFYYFITHSFSNEHQAVLKGRKAYYDSLKDIGENNALLRRNIHRLEKGLIMKPRRDVFGESFIQETVDCYSVTVKSLKLPPPEKKWVTDVLDEYFKTVGSTSIIDKASTFYMNSKSTKNDAIKPAMTFPGDNSLLKPYPHAHLPALEVDFESLKQLFIRRRSVRWYKSNYIPYNLVQKAVNIASFAPSACNRQPYKFLFCNEKEKAIEIAKCAGGTLGFAENIPAIIVIVGDLSAYPYERDRHLIYIDGSLAAMQLMLALETLGLSSCSINWPDIDKNEKKIRRIINLEGYEQIVMLLATGYADNEGGIPYSQKKENSSILKDISK